MIVFTLWSHESAETLNTLQGIYQLKFSHFWEYSGLDPTWELLHDARFTLAHPSDDHFNYDSGIDLIIFAGIITIYLTSGECSTPGGACASVSRVAEACRIQIGRNDVFLECFHEKKGSITTLRETLRFT